MPKEIDPVDALREKLGRGEAASKIVVGAIEEDTFEERQKLYEEEMKLLQAGGADYGGLDGWEPLRRMRQMPKSK